LPNLAFGNPLILAVSNTTVGVYCISLTLLEADCDGPRGERSKPGRPADGQASGGFPAGDVGWQGERIALGLDCDEPHSQALDRRLPPAGLEERGKPKLLAAISDNSIPTAVIARIE